MRNRQRWFYEAVRGAGDVRQWNMWVTWCSIALSKWPEGQIAFLKSVTPKEPLKSADACISYLIRN